MAGRDCTFTPLSGKPILLDGVFFSGAREIYCRRVYFALPGFDIRVGDIVMDLGANIGLFTTMAAVCGARVVAIEAQSGFHSIIEDNLRRNNCSERAQLELALVGGGTGILSSPQSRSNATHWGDEPRAATIRSLIQKHSLDRIDLLKIDIEGSEFDLFSGDLDWLKYVDRITMEVHTGFGDVHEIQDTLEVAGFSSVLLSSSNREIVKTITGPDGYLFATKRTVAFATPTA